MTSKKNLKELSSIGFSDILGTGITSVFWFFIASLIEPEKYGEIFFFIGIATIVSSVVLFAGQNTITVYVAKNIRIQSSLYLISLLASFGGSLVLIFWFYRLDIGLLVIGYVINALAIGEILGKKLFSVYSKYILLQKFSFVLFGLSLFYIFGPEGILYSLAISYFVFIIIILKGLQSDPWNFPLVKEHIGFIVNTYFFKIIQIIRSQIDKLIIPLILSYTVLGNYALALQIMAVLQLFPNIIFKFILPSDATGQSNKKIKLLTISISVIISILGILLAPIIIPQFLPDYIESINAIQIMSVVVVPTSVTLIVTSKFLGMENSTHVLISRILGLVVICPTMIILGMMFEITGVAIAYLLANTSSSVYLIISNFLVNSKTH